jgi:hypothetical protein
MAGVEYDDRISALDERVVREIAKIFEDSRPRRRFVFENHNMILGNAKSMLKIGCERSSVGHRTTERPDTIRFVPVDTYDQSEQRCAEKQYLSREGDLKKEANIGNSILCDRDDVERGKLNNRMDPSGCRGGH